MTDNDLLNFCKKLPRIIQEIEKDKEEAEKSLSAFIKQAWHVIEPGAPYVHNWHIDAMSLHLEAITNGQINRLLINVPPGSMKAIFSDEFVLTLDGWKRHGDLMPGDFVYSEKGIPISIIACTEEVIEQSYKVIFDDGSEIITGSDHMWKIEREFVNSETKWRRKRSEMIVSTPNLLTNKNTENTYKRSDRIKLCNKIWMPRRDLLIDPYILGAWIGDGGSNAGCIYSSEQDKNHFSKFGNIKKTRDKSDRGQAFYRITIPGLSYKLRALGLIKNKHIPDNYLFSTYENRLSLLQGLMDTDGCAAKNGECSFTNKNKKIADSVAYLVASIGGKPYLSSRYTMLNGKKYGPHYKISFRSPENVNIFNLPRKQEKVKCISQERGFYRYIKDVIPFGEKKVKCIQVEGSIYLVGKTLIPTHNSLIVNVFWPSWEWGPRKLPHLRYLCAAHMQNLSIRDNIKMRRLVMSNWYQSRYPHVVLMKDQNAKIKFENAKTGFKEAMAAGSITGSRGDRVIIDDPLSVDDSQSKVILESRKIWFTEAVPTRLINPEKSAIAVIMQRLNQLDTSGIILEQGGYECLILPMELEVSRKCFTTIGFEDPRKEEGELLFPSRFPKHVVERDKIVMGSFAVAGQFQQRPAPREGAIIKLDWLSKRFNIFRDEYGKVKINDFRDRYQSWDTAFKDGEQNDYTVCTTWGVKDDGFYILHRFKMRVDFPTLEQRAIELATEYVPNQIFIEDKASGQSLIQALKRRTKLPVKAVKIDRDKTARLNAVSGYFEAGKVLLPNGESWVNDFIEEMTTFPTCKHDDTVDSVTQFLLEVALRRESMMRSIHGSFIAR